MTETRTRLKRTDPIEVAKREQGGGASVAAATVYVCPTHGQGPTPWCHECQAHTRAATRCIDEAWCRADQTRRIVEALRGKARAWKVYERTPDDDAADFIAREFGAPSDSEAGGEDG